MRGASVQSVVFSMKTLRAFFPLSPRGTSGERAGERGKNGLLSPALSSFFGEEREKRGAAAPPSKLLAEQYWLPSCRWPDSLARRKKQYHSVS